MSIQHRSRIPSIVNALGNIDSLGACCYARAEEPILEYYNTCVSNGGHWQSIEGNDVSQVSCPELGATGCCCACSYVDDFRGATGLFKNHQDSDCSNVDDGQALIYPCYQGGLKNDVTFCECSDRGGIWARGTDCSVYTSETPDNGTDPAQIKIGAHMLCTQGEQIEDVRWPGACCAVGITCGDKCSTKECAEFGIAMGATGIEYWNSSFCTEPAEMPDADIINCNNNEMYNCGDDERNFDIDKRTGVRSTNRTWKEIQKEYDNSGSPSKLKSSCSYIKNQTIQCSNETKTACDNKKGVWSGFNPDGVLYHCSDDFTTGIQKYIQNQKRIDRDTVSSWKIGQSVWNVGRFVGEFVCKDDIHGIGSECLGSESTGISYKYRAENKDNNNTKTYAIIVANSDFSGKPISYEGISSVSNTRQSSSWDSLQNANYNTTSLTTKINSIYNKNIWFEHVVPSKDMLAFLYNQTTSLEFIENTTIKDETPNQAYTSLISDSKTFYWSSTFLTSIDYGGRTQLVNAQSFGDDSVVVYTPRNIEHMCRTICAIEIKE